jgi:hypothetical protein
MEVILEIAFGRNRYSWPVLGLAIRLARAGPW